MKGLAEVIDIVSAVVAALGQDIEFHSSSIVDSTHQKLLMHNTLWIRAAVGNRPADTVTIGATTYLVDEVEECEYIIVQTDEDADLIEPGTLDLQAPTFIHGTVVSAQNEIQQLTKVENNLSEKCPIVYLVEQLTASENYNELERLGLDADLRMFFLDTCDATSWLTDDHWTRVIDPMIRVKEEFVVKLKEHTRIIDTEIKQGRVVGHARVGRYSEKKQETDLFDAPFSGLEWRGNAPIEKAICC